MAGGSHLRLCGPATGNESIEVDLVARLDDGRLLTGEMKWSVPPVGPEVHGHLRRNLEDLGHSGHAWAREALAPSSLHLYVSARGFTEGFRRVRDADPRIKLLALDDLYAA